MKKKTLEEIEAWATTHTHFKLIPSQTYKDGKTSLDFTCDAGHIFSKSWASLSRGRGCPLCSITGKKTIEEVATWTLNNTDFKLLSKSYKNAHSHLEFLCKNGHIFLKSWSSLQSGCGCGECYASSKGATLGEIEGWVINNTQFKLLSKTYVNNKTPLNFMCPKGHIFRKSWNNVQQGQGCPCCNLAKSETKLGELLAEFYRVKPQFQVQCPEAIRSTQWIKVDFYLPEINTIVEYHGEQHYKWVPFFHKTELAFRAQQTRDQWLRDYCLENSINYWEISYLDFDHNSTELPEEGCRLPASFL